MKKIKGIVLENTGSELILLTADGEYIKAPASGQNVAIGEELEINRPARRRKMGVLALAASLVFVIAFSLLLPLSRQPEAYLALDINPGVLFALDAEAEVIEVEALNEEAEALLDDLQLTGQSAEEAVNQVLSSAHRFQYLFPGKDNYILVSLAAPEQYKISKEHLETSLGEQIRSLNLDTYLKILTASPEEAQKARKDNISLNAVTLDRYIREKEAKERETGEKDNGEDTEAEKMEIEEKKPARSVGDLLRQVPPEKLFEPDEFIPGQKMPDKAEPPKQEDQDKPGPPGQEKDPGPPQDVPGKPGEVPRPEPPVRPDEPPRKGPPETPPGQADRQKDAGEGEEKAKESKDSQGEGKEKEEKPGEKAPPGHEIAPPNSGKPGDKPATPPGQERAPGLDREKGKEDVEKEDIEESPPASGPPGDQPKTPPGQARDQEKPGDKNNDAAHGKRPEETPAGEAPPGLEKQPQQGN